MANRQRQKWAQQSGATHAVAAPAATLSPRSDVVGGLQQLADLRDAGALMDKEFVAAKARLLQN